MGEWCTYDESANDACAKWKQSVSQPVTVYASINSAVLLRTEALAWMKVNEWRCDINGVWVTRLSVSVGAGMAGVWFGWRHPPASSEPLGRTGGCRPRRWPSPSRQSVWKSLSLSVVDGGRWVWWRWRWRWKVEGHQGSERIVGGGTWGNQAEMTALTAGWAAHLHQLKASWSPSFFAHSKEGTATS